MSFFRKLGLDSITWSLRRLHCPVKKEDLVLEVGSGGNPYFRANILCDAYVETQERFFVPLIHDRPTIIASAENLPFKDGAFDFVIASHVLEHSADPKKFLEEIQRVGKAGYIEVPDAFMERLTHYTFHKLEITERDGRLLIRKKKNFIQDNELAGLFDYKAIKVFPEVIFKYPFHFHIRYYWSKDEGGIKYKIINPEYKFDWESPSAAPGSSEAGKLSLKTRFNKTILFLFRRFFSQNSRNKKIDLIKYLICVNCGKSLMESGDAYECTSCKRSYPLVRGKIPDFTEETFARSAV